jgi:hypothetical protein
MKTAVATPRGLFRIGAAWPPRWRIVNPDKARSIGAREDFATRSALRRQNRAKMHNSCG